MAYDSKKTQFQRFQRFQSFKPSRSTIHSKRGSMFKGQGSVNNASEMIESKWVEFPAACCLAVVGGTARVRHSRMLLAGIQEDVRTGPPIKTFGGDDLGVNSILFNCWTIRNEQF
jgi:hypothetical protein